jgi:hypothetical protein
LPVDWTVILYYAIGLAQVLFWALLGLKSAWVNTFLNREENYKLKLPGSQEFLPRNLIAPMIALAFLGSSFLVIEALSKPRYTKLSDQKVIALVVEAKISGEEAERNQVVEQLAANTIFGLQGRALHPRFYKSGDGELDGDFLLVEPMDFSRITFYLIGPDPASVILPFNTPEIVIPASSDVIVLRCIDSPLAAGVIVQRQNGIPKLYLSANLSQSCRQ